MQLWHGTGRCTLSECTSYNRTGCPENCSDLCHAAAEHQVAIFDATNSTSERRSYLINRFHGIVQYLFIESVCNDQETIRKNSDLKLKYSPDYVNMDQKQVHPFSPAAP